MSVDNFDAYVELFFEDFNDSLIGQVIVSGSRNADEDGVAGEVDFVGSRSGFDFDSEKLSGEKWGGRVRGRIWGHRLEARIRNPGPGGILGQNGLWVGGVRQ